MGAAMPQRVLCIEPDEALRARVRALLEAAGFAVDTSASGLDGIERALTLPPDLIVAGTHLGDMEGTELAARLRREKSLAAVPIVEVGAASDREAALAAGADGFLAPGFEERFAEEMHAYLAGKRETLPEAGEREQLRALSGAMAAHLESALSGQRRIAERLSEQDRLRTAFMQNLAHELSTPLTPLAGYLRILQGEKLGPLAPSQKRVVDAMMQSVARLSRIVDNLADFASLQAGRAPILEGEVDPDAMAEDVVSELRAAIKDARLSVEIGRAGGERVVADPRKLRQALANLVGNAVKFSPHGGNVLVEVGREPGKLRFTVYDQGPGIQPGESERIFEPLHHAAVRGHEEARAPGSGLGLPVARRIAEAHGGRVWVESPPRTQPPGSGRHFTGSKFVLEIPVRPVDRPGAGPGHAASGVTG
jgi:signal transduction histidine kinase